MFAQPEFIERQIAAFAGCVLGNPLKMLLQLGNRQVVIDCGDRNEELTILVQNRVPKFCISDQVHADAEARVIRKLERFLERFKHGGKQLSGRFRIAE